MFKKSNVPQIDEKVINIETGMQGNLKFAGPVSLRLNGNFEGNLEVKGTLIIGEKADVIAKRVKGDSITISGKVKGDVVCSKRLELSSSARVLGNVEAPLLIMNEGAIIRGNCQMPFEEVVRVKTDFDVPVKEEISILENNIDKSDLKTEKKSFKKKEP